MITQCSNYSQCLVWSVILLQTSQKAKVKDISRTHQTKSTLTNPSQKPEKSQATGDKPDTDNTTIKVVDVPDKMMCHSCKAEGHKYLAWCEICENWYCAKCQHLKVDTMKILIAYKSIHWFCSACAGAGGSVISNAKYNSPDTAIKQRFAEAMNNAMTSLQETVKKSEEKVELSYAEMVKKYFWLQFEEDCCPNSCINWN